MADSYDAQKMAEVVDSEFVDLADALEIVLNLARAQVTADTTLTPVERAFKLVCIDTVEDMAVNQFGDD